MNIAARTIICFPNPSLLLFGISAQYFASIYQKSRSFENYHNKQESFVAASAACIFLIRNIYMTQ